MVDPVAMAVDRSAAADHNAAALQIAAAPLAASAALNGTAPLGVMAPLNAPVAVTGVARSAARLAHPGQTPLVLSACSTTLQT